VDTKLLQVELIRGFKRFRNSLAKRLERFRNPLAKALERFRNSFRNSFDISLCLYLEKQG